MPSLTQFTNELKRPQPQPERLALAIAGIAYPDLDINRYLDLLDRLAGTIENQMQATPAGVQRAQRFLVVLNDELGFSGNRDHYYDPENSYLNVVLERRTGLPIMLCLICVAIGQRIGLAIDGIGFPGHFMARYRDVEGDWLLDPFNREILALEDAPAHLSRIFGQPLQLSSDAFKPVTPEIWAQRILFNLRNAYLGRQNVSMTVSVLNYLLAMLPHHPALWRERGMLHNQLENGEQAISDLRRSFFLLDQHALVWGDEAEKLAAQAKLGKEELQVLHLYQRLLVQRGRNN